MILTAKVKYAVMAVLDLCIDDASEEQSVKMISLDSIATKHDISLPYLEQIFANLRKKGIVKSKKGPGGGYFLNKKPQEIKIAEIIAATGENLRMTSCSKPGESCNLSNNKSNTKCKTHHLWHGLENKIQDYLESVTVLDVHNNNLN